MTHTHDQPLSLAQIPSNRICRKLFGGVEKKSSISIAKWRLILTLVSEPGVSGANITNHCAMEKIAANRTAHRLVNGENVARTRDLADWRSYRLKLMAEGYMTKTRRPRTNSFQN